MMMRVLHDTESYRVVRYCLCRMVYVNSVSEEGTLYFTSKGREGLEQALFKRSLTNCLISCIGLKFTQMSAHTTTCRVTPARACF